MQEIAGKLDGKELHVGIVVSRFNASVTDRLLRGALSALQRCGVDDEDVVVVRVPGGFEIPAAAQALAKRPGIDAIVCLGAVIRGETPHFDYICSHVVQGIRKVALQGTLPVTFGVLTTNDVEQALNRAGLKYGNKGEEAALSAVEMVHVMRGLQQG